MAVPTWSQLTFLTGPQQTKAAEFAAIGQAFALWKSGKGPKPSLSGVTYSQTKAADGLLRDLGSLIGPAKVGIDFAREEYRKEALVALEAANP
jgi:hypothetical protein